MKGVDVFLYAGESQMLAARMATLRGFFSSHLAVIANRTHQGDPTVTHRWINEARAAGCEVLPVDLSEYDGRARGGAGKPDYQVRERAHRDGATQRAVDIVGLDGLVFLSDVDEIPRPSLLEAARGVTPDDVWVYCMRMHTWEPHWLYPGPWWGTTVARGMTALHLGLQGMRDARANPEQNPIVVGFFGDLHTGGWHLSYWGSNEERARKLRSFSHAEHAHRVGDVEVLAEVGQDINGVALQHIDPSEYDWPEGL